MFVTFSLSRDEYFFRKIYYPPGRKRKALSITPRKKGINPPPILMWEGRYHSKLTYHVSYKREMRGNWKGETSSLKAL